MSAVIESQIRSAMGLAATPIPFAHGAPTPGMNQAIAANAPTPSLRCPRCRRTLVPVREGELQCTRPARPHSYPIVAGIPDLRATRDTDIAVARERADARFLAEMLSRVPADDDGRADDVALLSTDVSITGEGERYSPGASMRSTDEILGDWQELDQDSPEPRLVLDVGCGSGALLEAAARRWPVCVGVDGSLRKLVLARHRLQQAGVRARLVCANTDALPFSDGLFDRVIAEWILELSPRKERALREWNRMLGTQGRLWISTSNRWSVSRDPQLGIPALSWMPMRLLDVWAKWHGLTFPQRALVGTKRLQGLLEETGFSRVRLGKPAGEASHGTSRRRRDLALIQEIAKRVRPMLVATAGALPRARGRVAFERYVARQAL